MQTVLSDIQLTPAARSYLAAYLRVASDQVYLSQALPLSPQRSLLCQPALALIDNSLAVELWNYEPLQLIRTWTVRPFFSRSGKQLVEDDEWTLTLRWASEAEDKENGRGNGSTRGKGSNASKRQAIDALLEKGGRRDKLSIKKTLKSTIDYLMRQGQLETEQYGLPTPHARTGKATPASALSTLKNHSQLFTEYGLNSPLPKDRRQSQKEILRADPKSKPRQSRQSKRRVKVR